MSKYKWTLLPIIVFAFIYAVLISNGCCQQSPVVIAAISIASWFLTLADFCFSQTAALQENVDEQLSATESALIKVDNIRNLATERQKQLIIGIHATNDIQHYSAIETNIELQQKRIARYNKQLRNAVKGNVRNRRLGKALTVCGYVSLFAIILFVPEIQNGSSLDALTVWSFFIVLLGYFFGSLQVEQRMRQKQQSEDAIAALNTMEANLESEVRHNAD